MKKIFFAAVMSVFISGLFAGCVSMKGETAGEYIDDSTITSQVKRIILKDPNVQYFKIDVKTLQGDVVLIGFVNSLESEKALLLKIKEIRGVKSVKSLLKMEDTKKKDAKAKGEI